MKLLAQLVLLLILNTNASKILNQSPETVYHARSIKQTVISAHCLNYRIIWEVQLYPTTHHFGIPSKAQWIFNSLTSFNYTMHMYLHFLPKLVGQVFLLCVGEYPSHDYNQNHTDNWYSDHSNIFPTIPPTLQQYRRLSLVKFIGLLH